MIYIDKAKSRFLVEKLPEIPRMGDYFNIKIDNKEYIFDKLNLEKLKEHIERALNMN